MRRSARAVAAACAALSVALAGCTDQRGGADDGGGPSGTAAASQLSGPPLTLGFVTMENNALGSFPETREAAQAAVDHSNAALGGVDGRPLELVVCATNGSPESSQDCANTLVAARPLAVVGGIDFGTEAAMPIYEQAGIPYVTGSPQLSGELNSTNAFALGGGTVAELLGLTEYLTATQHATKVHALYVDLPGLLTAAILGSQNILRSKGVSDVTLVAEKADAADFAPALTRAADGDPDAIVVVFQAATCSRIVQAAASLQIDTPMFLVGACATPAVPRAAGGATDNLYFASSYLPVGPSGGDANTAAFRERVPEDDRSSASQGAFSAVLGVRSLLADVPEATPAALTAALRATHDHANAMAHPFTCDSKQVSIFPAICNTAVRLLQWENDGFVDITGDWIDGRALTEFID